MSPTPAPPSPTTSRSAEGLETFSRSRFAVQLHLTVGANGTIVDARTTNHEAVREAERALERHCAAAPSADALHALSATWGRWDTRWTHLARAARHFDEALVARLCDGYPAAPRAAAENPHLPLAVTRPLLAWTCRHLIANRTDRDDMVDGAILRALASKGLFEAHPGFEARLVHWSRRWRSPAHARFRRTIREALLAHPAPAEATLVHLARELARDRHYGCDTERRAVATATNASPAVWLALLGASASTEATEAVLSASAGRRSPALLRRLRARLATVAHVEHAPGDAVVSALEPERAGLRHRFRAAARRAPEAVRLALRHLSPAAVAQLRPPDLAPLLSAACPATRRDAILALSAIRPAPRAAAAAARMQRRADPGAERVIGRRARPSG